MPSETLISHFKPSSSPLTSPKQFHTPATKSPPTDHPNRLLSMICSAPTTATSSKWLQRLRSSRGFPDSDHIDLEHFLSTSRENTDPPPPPEETVVTENYDDDNNNKNNNNNNDNGAVQGRDLINSVLSDLFYMGDCEDQLTIKKKKSCRKQLCPRICAVTNLDDQNVTVRRNRVSSSRHRVKEVNQVMDSVEEEDGRAHRDLSAYSQTEVTVIDTSVSCWKFEKMLYRSKNIWKVGDKKGKGLMSGDGKKRKERVSETGDDVQKKKLKKKLKLCSSSKEELMVSSKFDQGYEQGKMVVGSEKKRDNCSQLQEKSFSKKQIDEGSSVILIKIIPTTSKKNVSGVSNSCVKSTQR